MTTKTVGQETKAEFEVRWTEYAENIAENGFVAVQCDGKCMQPEFCTGWRVARPEWVAEDLLATFWNHLADGQGWFAETGDSEDDHVLYGLGAPYRVDELRGAMRAAVTAVLGLPIVDGP